PNSFEARLLLARSLVAGGDGDRAEPALRQLVRERPDDSVVRAAVGQLLLLRGRRTEAQASFASALAADPSNLEATWGLTSIDLEADRRDAALERLKATASLKPRDANVQFVAGVAFARAGDVASAEGHLRNAIEIDPQFFAAYARLGQLYFTE